MRKLIVIVAMLAGLVVPAASAQATPYLGIGEAKRALGAELHRSFKYGAQRGSMLAFCGRRAWNVVRCDLLFTDLDGDTWCGGARVRETSRSYWVSWRVSMRNCGEF